MLDETGHVPCVSLVRIKVVLFLLPWHPLMPVQVFNPPGFGIEPELTVSLLPRGRMSAGTAHKKICVPFAHSATWLPGQQLGKGRVCLSLRIMEDGRRGHQGFST